MAGTAQGLFNSTIGLAGVVSALLTGSLFDLVGSSGMFSVMGFCCLVASFLFAGMNLINSRRENLAVKVEEVDGS